MPPNDEGRNDGAVAVLEKPPADPPPPETAPAHKVASINVVGEDDRTITLQYPSGEQRRISKEWYQAESRTRRPIVAETRGVFVVQELNGTISVVSKEPKPKPAEIYPGEIVVGQTPTHWVIDSNGAQYLQPKRFY